MKKPVGGKILWLVAAWPIQPVARSSKQDHEHDVSEPRLSIHDRSDVASARLEEYEAVMFVYHGDLAEQEIARHGTHPARRNSCGGTETAE